MKSFYLSLMALICFSCQSQSNIIVPSTPTKPDTSTTNRSNQTSTLTSDTINIPFEKFTLPNGLDVIFHNDQRLPVVHVNIWYHVGSKNDPKNILGFAHLFEHMMFQGTKHAPREFLEYFNELSATDTNATTSQDRTNYFNTVPTEHLEALLWLESERMGFMTEQLDDKQFANQKDVVKNEARERSNKPYYELAEASSQLYPDGHPYKHLPIGDLEQLSKATLEDVKEFYSRYYVPNNATIVIAGNFDSSQAKAWVEKYFGGLKPGAALTRTSKWIPKLDSSRLITVEKNVPFEVVSWTWLTPEAFSNEEIPLDFAAKILASDENSRLYKILVHDKQLATEVSAVMDASELNGEFGVLVALRPGASLVEVKNIVQAEIQNFAKSGPTADELQRIKAQVEYSFLSSLESLSGKANLLNQFNTYLGDPSYYKTIYQNYQNVDAKTIQTDFQNWVASANSLEVHFIPKSPAAQTDNTSRDEMPNPSQKAAFKTPVVEKAVLENGLEIFVSNQPDLPKVLVSLSIKTGNYLETAEKAGTAFLTSGALERGTTNLSFLEIKDKTSRLGASISSAGSKYGAGVSLSTLKRHLNETFSLMSDIILNPSFPNDEIDRLKKERLDGIEFSLSKPSSIANNLLDAKLFGNTHPKGIDAMGTKLSLQNITRDDILNEYKTFWHPNNAYITFVGDITLAEAKELVSQYLKNWAKADVPQFTMTEAGLKEKTKIYVVDFPGAPQTSIRIAFPAPNRIANNYYAFRLADAVLGGGMAGRLFKNLREDKGYTYGAYSSYNTDYFTGDVTLSAEAQSDKTLESLEEFKKEMADFKDKNPPQSKEVESEKLSMIQEYVRVFGSNSGIMQRINMAIDYKMSFSIFDEYPKLIENQTLADVRQSIQDVVPDKGFVVMLVGDANVINSEIEKIDWADVEYIDSEGNPIK